MSHCHVAILMLVVIMVVDNECDYRLGHVECVRLLLKVGGDPTQPDEYTAPEDRVIAGTMTPMYYYTIY